MKKLKQLLLQEKGVSALYLALVLFVLLGMAGIALDGSYAYVQRRRMQTAADFAALAGARTLALGGDSDEIDEEVHGLALANGVGNLDWQMSADGRSVEAASSAEIAIDWHYIDNGQGIEVSVANNYDTFFAVLLGYDTITSTANAAAGYLPVVGVDNLIPLAVNACDCLNFDELPVNLTQADFADSVTTCSLYPIALNTQTLIGATPGANLGNIWNGTGPGNFGWLTWAGAPNVPTLVQSLTPPGDSHTYTNPYNTTDRLISVGDWVQGSPGVSNASDVRAALDVLKTMDITVPVWDQATGNGNNSLYRVANFAIVRITDYNLPSQNRITATFVGYATDCGGAAPTPTVPPPTAIPSTPTFTPVPPTATPSATMTPAAGGSCLVTYRVNSDWGSGFTADVFITNQTGAAYNSWSITWTFAGNQKITNLWNGALTQTAANVRVNNASWNGAVNQGATVNFGFQATYSGPNVAPTAFVVNGIACNGGASPLPTPTATLLPVASASPTSTPTATATPSAAPPTPTPASPTGSCALDAAGLVLNRYTLIVLDDLSTSSDIENRAFVGGSLVSSMSANIGINVSGIPATEPMFIVVGNLAVGNPLNLNAGSLLLGGNRNGRPINFNGGGSLIQDPTIFDTQITALLQSATAQLATQPVNNAVTLPTGQPGPARFNVTTTTPAGVAIFQVASGDLFGNNLVQQIELNPGTATTVMINVTGSTVDWSGNGNMVGNFTNSYWRSRVLWNFPQASSINLRSHNMMGAVLAPYAQVTTSANLDGSVAVRALTTSAEVHQPIFNGDLGALCEEEVTAPPTTPCQLVSLDWDGGLSSNGELADDLSYPNHSGVRQVGDWIDAGPAVTDAQQVTNALAQWLDQPALIVFYDEGDQQNGYQICGFAEFTLTDFDLAALPPWLQGRFSPALVRGLTDPDAPDYGLRDIRFK